MKKPRKETSLGKLFKQKLQLVTPSRTRKLQNETNIESSFHKFKNKHQRPKEEILNDCLDVDMGVPYVESRHLDSGFDLQENEPSNAEVLPKNQPITGAHIVSSAKQIFESEFEIEEVLALSQDSCATEKDVCILTLDFDGNDSPIGQQYYLEQKPATFEAEKDVIQKLKQSMENRKGKLEKWNSLIQNSEGEKEGTLNQTVHLIQNRENSHSYSNISSFASHQKRQLRVNHSRSKSKKFEQPIFAKRKDITPSFEKKQNDPFQKQCATAIAKRREPRVSIKRQILGKIQNEKQALSKVEKMTNNHQINTQKANKSFRV